MTADPEPSRRERGEATRVLVAFAGVHGSTRSIAERITARLQEQGLQADALPVEAVDDLRVYDAFVVGSAVHDMAWLPEALALVRREAELFVRHGVWIFSVGMPAAMRGPWKALAAKEEDQVVGSLIDELRPRGHRLFSGVIRPEHLPRTGRVKFRAMGLRYGDYRDWPAIDAWAQDIAHAILGRGTGPGGPT